MIGTYFGAVKGVVLFGSILFFLCEDHLVPQEGMILFLTLPVLDLTYSRCIMHAVTV